MPSGWVDWSTAPWWVADLRGFEYIAATDTQRYHAAIGADRRGADAWREWAAAPWGHRRGKADTGKGKGKADTAVGTGKVKGKADTADVFGPMYIGDVRQRDAATAPERVLHNSSSSPRIPISTLSFRIC